MIPQVRRYLPGVRNAGLNMIRDAGTGGYQEGCLSHAVVGWVLEGRTVCYGNRREQN